MDCPESPLHYLPLSHRYLQFIILLFNERLHWSYPPLRNSFFTVQATHSSLFNQFIHHLLTNSFITLQQIHHFFKGASSNVIWRRQKRWMSVIRNKEKMAVIIDKKQPWLHRWVSLYWMKAALIASVNITLLNKNCLDCKGGHHSIERKLPWMYWGVSLYWKKTGLIASVWVQFCWIKTAVIAYEVMMHPYRRLNCKKVEIIVFSPSLFDTKILWLFSFTVG